MEIDKLPQNWIDLVVAIKRPLCRFHRLIPFDRRIRIQRDRRAIPDKLPRLFRDCTQRFRPRFGLFPIDDCHRYRKLRSKRLSPRLAVYDVAQALNVGFALPFQLLRRNRNFYRCAPFLRYRVCESVGEDAED